MKIRSAPQKRSQSESETSWQKEPYILPVHGAYLSAEGKGNKSSLSQGFSMYYLTEQTGPEAFFRLLLLLLAIFLRWLDRYRGRNGRGDVGFRLFYRLPKGHIFS